MIDYAIYREVNNMEELDSMKVKEARIFLISKFIRGFLIYLLKYKVLSRLINVI